MSSKKTEHYDLHLWEPSDSFLRTEFNENSCKIDTALNALDIKPAHALLADTTAGAASQHFSLSLESIDKTRWWELIVCVFVPEGTGDPVQFKMNYPEPFNPTCIPDNGTGSSSTGVFSKNMPTNYKYEGIFILPRYHICNTILYQIIKFGGPTPTSSRGFCATSYDPFDPNLIKSVDVTGAVPAGTRIRVWGVT